jgi:hypothetical protein
MSPSRSPGGGPGSGPLLSPEELGRRVRAARAYADLSISALAPNLSTGAKRLQRIEAGKLELSPVQCEATMAAVEAVCGLPSGWIINAFPSRDSVLAERRRLSQRIRQLEDVLSRL